jgi:hypothetical protein
MLWVLPFCDGMPVRMMANRLNVSLNPGRGVVCFIVFTELSAPIYSWESRPTMQYLNMRPLGLLPYRGEVVAVCVLVVMGSGS